MIYTEQLVGDLDNVVLTRQKNGIDKEWYGLMLEYKDGEGRDICADNENWIRDQLNLLNDRQWSHAGANMNVFWDKANLKDLRKVLRQAYELGWFNLDFSNGI